ncbi:MAG: cysteine--tRNA ligase [Solobacterium sp.]|nr:cysteine--tRNA ligase [Solobacterium sp.]
MRLYNTKTLRVQEFHPIKEGHVDMYVCGPTVYNYAHIGNARPMVVFDVLKRLFEAEGYTVTYASNFTDVDDKIIKKAADEGTTEAVIAERYIDAYQEVRKLLNTELPDITPRVTETMDEIIAFIDELMLSGHAYEANGDVYFSVDSVPTYGEISHQKLNMLEAGARIEANDQKRNPYDFALWKKTDMGIKWSSPWGEGRPGWHTECVVMINNNLGRMIDIHGGGMDLKFPHHENEAAQQEACNGNCLANYWIHNAMVNIDGIKMSKSLGNVLWAKDIVDRLGTNLTRWLMSSVHYRKELNFSDETIETARKELDRVMTPLKQADVKAAMARYVFADAYDEESYRAFLDQMDDDMNTPNAYAVIYDTVKKLNGALRQREIDFAAVGKYRNAVEKMLDILGVVVVKPEVTDEDIALFEKWNEAKKNKDFASADVYRGKLAEKGLL